MKINVYEDYEEMSQKTADFIIYYVNRKPDALLCLPGGNTPIGVFKKLVASAKNKGVSFDQCHFVGLDEWVGMDKDDVGSCQHQLYTHFFDPVGIHREQIHFFNAHADSLETECQRIDDLIFSNGSIDLMLLGLGVNGHLGFNEPGASPDLLSHVIDLDPITIKVGQEKYFTDKKNLGKGITLGLRHILNANCAVLIANGDSKAEAVKKTVEGKLTDQVPASALQLHENCIINLDKKSVREF